MPGIAGWLKPKMSPTVPREEVAEQTFRQLRRVMVAFQSRLRANLGRHGLTLPQFFVLKFLRKRGRATAKELADALEVTPANITGVLDRLEREGLVSRARSSDDRRVVHVRLTDDGHARMAKLISEGSVATADLFEGWTSEDLRRLNELLGKVRLRPEELED